MGNHSGGCCTINGDCTSPETAMRNGTCYLIIFILLSLALIIISVMNLMQHSDISFIVYGSLIHIVVHSFQILHKAIIICYRKSLLSSGCCIPCCSILCIVCSTFVVGPTVALSVMAQAEIYKNSFSDNQEITGDASYGVD